MTLWFVLALMTAAAALAALWPLSRASDVQAGSDLAVYRDQLEELDRDRAAGLIGEVEAQAARVDISRRLITAADVAEFAHSLPIGSSLWRRRAITIAAVGLLPLVAATLYLTLGSPELPGQPLEAQLRAAHENRSIANLVSQAEAHLERDPDDAGEALTAAANGIVTVDAKTAFDRALVLDPKELKATFFIGLAAKQDGDRAKAATIWRDMLEGAPRDTPWLPKVREALARVRGAPTITATPGPSAEDVAAAGNMSEKDRSEMIRGMVAQLADRLMENGNNIEGWQRLLRAYMVLGERDKAHAAAADAKRALAKDPDKLRRIEHMINSLGLEG
jgi:cytochrome c-type biogenesis protein CcmH